jgi:hypothetical protein
MTVALFTHRSSIGTTLLDVPSNNRCAQHTCGDVPCSHFLFLPMLSLMPSHNSLTPPHTSHLSVKCTGALLTHRSSPRAPTCLPSLPKCTGKSGHHTQNGVRRGGNGKCPTTWKLAWKDYPCLVAGAPEQPSTPAAPPILFSCVFKCFFHLPLIFTVDHSGQEI